jgi:hypothetical protein
LSGNNATSGAINNDGEPVAESLRTNIRKAVPETNAGKKETCVRSFSSHEVHVRTLGRLQLDGAHTDV